MAAPLGDGQRSITTMGEGETQGLKFATNQESIVYLPPVRSSLDFRSFAPVSQDDRQARLIEKLDNKLRSRATMAHSIESETTHYESSPSSLRKPLFKDSTESFGKLSRYKQESSKNTLRYDQSSVFLKPSGLGLHSTVIDSSLGTIEDTLDDLKQIDQALTKKLRLAGLGPNFDTT